MFNLSIEESIVVKSFLAKLFACIIGVKLRVFKARVEECECS
jgi:hypothetical protein